MLPSLTGSQMQVVAIHWHVYLLTRSPLALGMVGLTRALPIVALALWGGIVADRHDRRLTMARAQMAMAAVAAALCGLTVCGRETVWAIYALSALSAAASAFDGPSRQALVPRLVPVGDLPGALALNLTAFHGAMILGPALAGALIAGGSAPSTPLAAAASSAADTRALGWIYGLNALSFVPVVAALLSLDAASGSPAPGHRPAGGTAASLREGFRFVFASRPLVWTMALDFFATFFSGATSLLPIFADQVLHAGPAGYGLLAAAPAFGALAGSLWLALRPLPGRQGRVLLWAVTAYGLATVAFGASRWFWLTFAALAATGLADLVSTVVRQMLRQLVTPDRLRGRMTSVNMIFFMGGPQLGEVEAGLVASLFASAAVGATVSVVSGGLATLAVVAVVAFSTRAVRDWEWRKIGP